MNSGVEELIEYCRSDHNIGVIEEMIQKGVAISEPNEHGMIPIHVAAAFGQVELLEILLKHGSDIDAADKLGWTPIMQAARNGHSVAVEKLLAAGANAHLKTHYGANLLFLATASNDIKTIYVLRNALSEINLLKQAKESQLFPLAIAITFENMSTIKALVDIHSEVNFTSPLGLTPLMVACAVGNPMIANYFLDKNAEITHLNFQKQTALDIAELCQNNHIIRLLKGKQAEDDSISKNRAHLTTQRSKLHEQHITPVRIRYPSPGSNSTKYALTPMRSPASNTETNFFNLPSPSYVEHILSSAKKNNNLCSLSPQNRNSKFIQRLVSPSFSPYSKQTSQTSNSPLETNSHTSPSGSSPRWARNPDLQDKLIERKVPWGTDIDSSGYGSSMDAYKNSQIHSRQVKLSDTKPLFMNSHREEQEKISSCPKVCLTPYSKSKDSDVKLRWRGLRKTISKLKSPKPKYSFCPQARMPSEPLPQQTSARNLELLLQEMDLAIYAPLFLKQELDVETFLKLTEEDLKEIGINGISVQQIMTAINSLK